MDMQNVSNLEIPEGEVRTIHDKDNRLLWGRVHYDTKYKGDTTQTTYSGKNLFDFDNDRTIWRDPSYMSYVNDSNSCTMTATGTNGAQFARAEFGPLDSTKTYTLSGKAKKLVGGSDGSPVLQVFYYYSDDGVNYTYGSPAIFRNSTPTVGTEYSFNGSVSGHAYYRLYFYNNGGTPVTIGESSTYYDIQFEQSASATPYEPYVGGIPSPNPQFPQSINVVTGKQTVVVREKNLFDKAITPGYMSSNMSVEQLPTGIRAINDDIVTTSDIRLAYYKVCDLSDVMGKTITVKANISASSTNYPRVIIGFARSNYGNRVTKAQLDSSGSASFVVEGVQSDQTMIFMGLYATLGRSSGEDAPAGAYSDYTDLQVEIGNTPTDYEAYITPQTYTIDLGSTELCKIGTYQDYIYKSGDDWYVHKATNKVTLDGTETWSGSGSVFQTTNSTTPNKGSASSISYSNYFTWAYYPSATAANIKNGEFGWDSVLALTMRNDNITGSANFKTWLSTNNVSIYYNLATPTDTKITDATLIGQLNAIHEWLVRYGYYGTVSTSLPSILPMIIDRTNL